MRKTIILSTIIIFLVQTIVLAIANNENTNPLQNKIHEASPGDTIKIGQGTFSGYFVIDKPITLIGDGWEKTAIVLNIDIDEIKEKLSKIDDPTTAKELIEEMKTELSQPLLFIKNTQDVKIQDIKFSIPCKPDGKTSNSAVVIKINNSKVQISRCAILGSLDNGIQIENDSDIQIDNTLVAAAWSTGIVIGEKSTKPSKVAIMNSDIRNCRYAGIRIRPDNNNVTISKCRISGAAWHGLRYDDASPKIHDNIFFGSARMGIYASGKTEANVRNNLFYDNDMGGMSCWFENKDLIEENTFIQNKQAGLAINGKSKTVVKKNIFFDNPIGIIADPISDNGQIFESDGNVDLEDNLFWKTDDVTKWLKSGNINAQDNSILTHKSGPIEMDPQFKSEEQKDFSLNGDSPVRELGIGAANLIPLESPWPIQPEETAIIPDGDTRDYNKWKTD